MLTVKEIKQAVEFADGFEISGEKLMYKGRLCDFKQWIESYDFFLDRIIQGINRGKCRELQICTYNNSIEVWKVLDIDRPVYNAPHNITTEGIREVREKVIRFVLKEGA